MANSEGLSKNQTLKGPHLVSSSIAQGSILSIDRRSRVRKVIILGIFNQRPGKYHGFLSDAKSGGTYVGGAPEQIFKWSLGSNKKDVENRIKIKEDIFNTS